MQPKVKICKKCPHECNQEFKETEQMSTIVINVYAEWSPAKKKSKVYPTLHCKIAKETIGFMKNRKFYHNEDFTIPEGCPYILEHTVS